MAFSEEIKKKVWNKATLVEGYNPELVRKDPCNAWILWDKYGDQENIYGWEIDHIIPKALLESHGVPESLIDHIDNLRVMQHQNNASKSDDYPSYTAVVTAEDNRNVEKVRNLTVNEKTRKLLSNLYKN